MIKFKTVLLLLAAGICVQVLTSSQRDPNNPPVKRTGAPGETTCGASGCHSGGSFVGTVSMSGVPDTVQPSQVYNITVTHTSNAARAGFELVCLDGLNSNCGTLSTATGVSIGSDSGTGRRYARQSSPHNFSGSTTWSFNWTAPATLNNNNITFYFASLAANGNGNKTGDNPLLGTFNTVLASPVAVGITEVAAHNGIEIYPMPAADYLHIDLPKPENARIELYDLQGKRLIAQNFTHQTVLDVSPLAAGIYIVKIEQNNQTFSQKVVVR